MTLKEERRRRVLDEQDRDAGDEEERVTNADESPGGSGSFWLLAASERGPTEGFQPAPAAPSSARRASAWVCS